jgi:hypothetical protein
MHCLILMFMDRYPCIPYIGLPVLLQNCLSALPSYHALIRQQCCRLSMHTVFPTVKYCPAWSFCTVGHKPVPLLSFPGIDLHAMSSVHWSFCNVIRTLALLQCHPYIGPPAMSSVHWSSCSVIRSLVLLQSHPYIGPPALLSVHWSSCSVIRALVLLQCNACINPPAV